MKWKSKLQFMSTYYVTGPYYALSLIPRATLQGRDVVNRAPEARGERVLISSRKCTSRISSQIQRPMLTQPV